MASPMNAREQRMYSQLLLIRETLGLNPIHDVVSAVRMLHDNGRDAFMNARGPKCEYSYEWQPN